VVWDSSRQALSGTNAPFYLSLTRAQIRSGSVVYISPDFADRVRFRLDAVAASGDEFSESMLSVAPAPNSAAGNSVAPPAVRHDPPREPQLRRPAPAKLPNKNFVPPRTPRTVTGASAGESPAPDPPKILPDPGPNPVASLTPTTAEPAVVTPRTRLNIGPPNGLSNEGVVTITSEPSGARVEINSIPSGVTPVTLKISPTGLDFTVTVAKNGFMNWTVQSVSAAHPVSLHAQLRQVPK